MCFYINMFTECEKNNVLYIIYDIDKLLILS